MSPQFAPNVTKMPLAATVDSDVLAFARRLQAENPKLKNYRIVQLADSWHASQTPSTQLSNPLETPDVTTNFACSSSGPYSTAWNGNAPPNCDLVGNSAGPFRGVFSVPGKVAAQGWVTVPDSSATMPTDGNGGGFIYIEGWPKPGTTNAEGGLAYAAAANDYAPYVAGPGNPEHIDAGYTISPNTQVLIFEGAVINNTVTYPPSEKGDQCSTYGGCAAFYFAYPIPGDIYTDKVRIPDAGMNPNIAGCCIFQRMTSIGIKKTQMYVGTQGPPSVWSFGPVSWNQSYTMTYSQQNGDVPDGDGFTSGWILGTFHNLFPDAAGYTNYVNCPAAPYLTVNYTNAEVETDTISVPKALPSQC
jgi:hypothetical protein